MHEYMVPAQDSDIVDVPAGEAIRSQSFTMSEDKEDEESAAGGVVDA